MKISFSPTPTLKKIKNWGTLTACVAFLLGRHSFLFYLLENQHVHSQKPSCLGVIFISNHLQLGCYPTYKHGVFIWKKRKLIDGKRELTPHVVTPPNANIYWLPMCGLGIRAKWLVDILIPRSLGLDPFGTFLVTPVFIIVIIAHEYMAS
jgi:hypothetical protein